MRNLETILEWLLFRSRWLLAPFFFGLIVALFALLGGILTDSGSDSIVSISAVELLKGFIDVEQYTTEQPAWKVGIHVTFVVPGVLFAVTDRIAEGKGGRH